VAKASVRPGQRKRKGILQKELFVACRPEACRQPFNGFGPAGRQFAVLHQSPCPKARAISIVSYHDHSACFDEPIISRRHGSNVDHACPTLNFCQGHEIAVTGTGTRFAHRVPGVATFEIRVPEWPCAALRWARRVHTAAPRLGIEKRTVAVFVFREGDPTFDDPRVLLPQLLDGQSAKLGDLHDFCFSDPNDARCPCATIAALRTRETEPVLVPRQAFSHVGSLPFLLRARQRLRAVAETSSDNASIA
jgi:hypothetical protein